MVNVKALYLAKSVNELQDKGKIGDTSKSKVKQLCESSEKVIKGAEVEKDLGDEEKAYVLYFKYIELVGIIKKKQEFKNDEKYYKSMFNIPKNFKKAVESLEGLTESLEKRYNEKLKLETLKEISDEVESNKIAKKNKLKFDINSNENLTSTPIIVKNGSKAPEVRDYIITHKQLFSLISERSSSFFILDTRSSDDYQNSCISLPQSLNIPEHILKPGTTASTIGKSLQLQERCQWETRTQKDKLIICDWLSEDFLPGTPVTVLRDALTMWDVGSNYKQPPFLLEGGFQKFLYAYPHYVTNPKARAPSESRNVIKSSSKIDVNYPDLDNGFLVTPSPSPKHIAAVNSGALKISKEPHRQDSQAKYPSLSSDLNSLTPKSIPKTSHQPPSNLSSKFPSNSIPSINRATKPGSNPSTMDFSKDEFNEARQSFSINKTDSGSSINSNFSSTSELNEAVLESKSINGQPVIDRDSKKSAVLKYYGGDETSLTNVENVQKVEINVVDKSLEREKEKLDLENKWEFLRVKREAANEAVMRQEIMDEQEKLVAELDKLAIENKEKEASEKKLLEELESLKAQLKVKDKEVRTYQKNEEERQRMEHELKLKRQKQKEMLESVEIKRRERRRKEKEMRKDTRPQPSVNINGFHERGHGQDAGAGVQDDQARGGSGGLKRSFSSPNIAKMLESEDGGLRLGYQGVPVPKFDRSQKPSLISARNFAGVWGTQKPGLTGLKNLGNTCYMNSILQCVSNTPPLAHYFVSRSFEEDVNEKYSKTRGQIAREFAEVLKHLWSSQYKSISASDLKSRVGRHKFEFAGRDQQDSHEFLLSLLEWLHEDVNKVPKPSCMPEQNNKDRRDVSAAKRHWINYLERNQSIIVQLFCGQTRSVVRCHLCQGESVTYREFTNLTLPLPEHSNRTSLRECMELYLREEHIDEFKCDLCKRTGKVTKKTDIVKFPPLLIIHLSRFYQDGMYTRKKQNFVNFDLKNLNMSHYAVNGFDNKHSRFNLYAVSNHFGSLEGGHYTAYCSSDVLKKWYKFDDQDVSVMEAADVVTPAAYILFYTALEGQNSLPPLG